MSNYLSFYRMNKQITAVSLPFNIDVMISDWLGLRPKMVKNLPNGFSRDEWAYLISFLCFDNLVRPFENSFGEKLEKFGGDVQTLLRPRGHVALWLPNNVSLLGPLILILLSLSGNSISIKGGSQSENLTNIFISYIISTLPDEVLLKKYLLDNVLYQTFDRHDSRNIEMAKNANIRIIFGSDEAAANINSIKHPIESIGFNFINRKSEVWIEKNALNESSIDTLIKVFAIYGQAGCTSPGKVTIVDGDQNDVKYLKDRIVEKWSSIIPNKPDQYIASNNILAKQLALSSGWAADLTNLNGSLIAAGSYDLKDLNSLMALPIVWAGLEQAIDRLPENIQTLGYILNDPKEIKWLNIISKTKIKRFVPVEKMHHFSFIWDGYKYWQQLFETVEVL
ncbi:acyl-CoA reductase [Desulfobacula sp.]|uniref:acyl-CoA reductase n=1 Tax=Desulfobacula sp. TaxID=2593537 RepID=UPI00271493B2|nr:acyl-CoA reductase [Desulfobacula sp.]